MIKSIIKDGKGRGTSLSVDNNRSIITTNSGVPPDSIETILKPFSVFMTDLAGDNNMRVDGSTTNVEFSAGSSSEGDRYIQSIAFTIGDGGIKFELFGALPVLTNGCQLRLSDKKLGDVILGGDLKTNFNIFQLCLFNPAFGNASEAFLIKDAGSSLHAYIPILDLRRTFGLPYGFVIPQDSEKKVIFTVRDDIQAMDQLDIKVFGFDRIG